MTLYNDDCLTVLTTFPDESIDMIYLDPPFYTQKRQTLADSSGRRFELRECLQDLKTNSVKERVYQSLK